MAPRAPKVDQFRCWAGHNALIPRWYLEDAYKKPTKNGVIPPTLLSGLRFVREVIGSAEPGVLMTAGRSDRRWGLFLAADCPVWGSSQRVVTARQHPTALQPVPPYNGPCESQ